MKKTKRNKNLTAKATGGKEVSLALEYQKAQPVETLSKRAQLVYYKDRTLELKDQLAMQNNEHRTMNETIRGLTDRCERYERVIDQLTGRLR